MNPDRLLQIVSEELLPISKGKLHCLPYAKVLLKTLHLLGAKDAKEVVARAVIFGKQNQVDYEQLFSVQHPLEVINAILTSDKANGIVTFPSPLEKDSGTQLAIPYRTLGYSHGINPSGALSSDGKWTGHIIVTLQNFILDPTIAQINSPECGIAFDPNFIAVQTSNPPFRNRYEISFFDGIALFYEAFPDERTYLASESWGNTDFSKELDAIAERAATRVVNEMKSSQARP